MSAGTQATFGYSAVDPVERQARVNEVFASVASRYDLMNDLMSGGLHRAWKDAMVTMVAPPSPRNPRPFSILDVAGGTGDIAMRLIGAAGFATHATVCDISPEMVSVGRERIAAAGLSEQIDVTVGDAQALAFPDRSFDAYTIAFGIRNVTRIDVALSEAFRVLKPGGRFVCLEFSKVDVPLLDRLYDLHSFEVIPQLGGQIAGDAASYRYLVESIRQFPNQDAFADLIRGAGFARVSYRNLTGGIAALHAGWRL
ncbi:MAG: bifunctional demethylmenaquinone methyltransferase/2-methoxy-6-polyprenyl-1,4-benzoquinol methylase UbiE [Pseudomonadota bacterium]